MAPDPQVLARLYMQKVALAPGREAALTKLVYAATVLDIYSGIPEDSPDSASAHLRKARSGLIYLDRVRQGSSFSEATSDPHYSEFNLREQRSQLTVLAQTNLAIAKATGYGHTDTVDTLVELKKSFESYSIRVGEICAREQDEDSPYASSTAISGSTEAHPTQRSRQAGPSSAWEEECDLGVG